MNKIVGLAALAEVGTGAILLAYPQIVIRLLFATEIGGVGIVVGRFAGIALIGLGAACWPGNSVRQQIYGMLAYSTLVTLYLIVVGLGGAVGILLWPAVVAHAAIAILLVRAWLAKRKQTQ